MSSIFEEYDTVLGKSCKKNPLSAKLYSQYLCAFLAQVIHETNDKTVT